MSVKSKIHQRVAVIGLGSFGNSLAKELTKSGIQVLAIDEEIELVDKIADFVDHAICLDAKDTDALEKNGILRMDAVAVCIGNNFQDCALVTAQLLELKVPRVIARANGEVEAQILKKIGAHETIFLEQEMGRHWASLLARPGAIQDFEVSKNYSIVRIPPSKDWVGKSLAELRLPHKQGITVLGFYKDEQFDLIKDPETLVQSDHEMLVIGHYQDIDRFFAQEVKKQKL